MWNFKASLLLLALVCGFPYAHATITNTTTRTESGLGNGTSTNFTISFPFQDNDQILVYLKDTTALTLTQVTFGTGAGKYTITGGDPGTTVVMGTAPTTSQKVIIQRSSGQTQTVNYDENSAFPAEDHEEQMDKMVQSIQELNYSVSTKIGLSTFSTPENGDIPRYNGTDWEAFNIDDAFIAAGTADVLGPSGATDNAVARFDGATGKVIQNSQVLATDSGTLSIAALTANKVVTTNGTSELSTSTTSANDIQNATFIQGKPIVTTNLGNGRALVYNSNTDKVEYTSTSTVGAIISNQVTTGVRGEFANLQCDADSTVPRQSGEWISAIGNRSSATCTVTIKTGIFSALPACVGTRDSGTNSALSLQVVSATSFTVTHSSSADFDANVICMGLR